MRIFIILFILAIPSYSLAEGQSVFGKWQFSGGTAVYLEILESRTAIQCRIDQLGNIIKANGQYKEDSTIEWGAIKIYYTDGRIEGAPMGIEWGVDSVVLENDALYLDGQYGKFSFRKTSVIHHKCLLKDQNS